jgi:alcohol dehydrogenase (cytochrome c)
MAMDALTGQPLWWTTLGTLYRTDVEPKLDGSGPVWPDTGQGAEAYNAVDNNNTLYVAVSSMGYNPFVKGNNGYLVPLMPPQVRLHCTVMHNYLGIIIHSG